MNSKSFFLNVIWIRTQIQTQLENDNHLYPIFNFHQNGNGKILVRTMFNLYQPQKRPSPSTLTSISFLSYRALILLTYSIRKRRKIWLKKLLLFLQFPLRLNSADNHWTDISTFSFTYHECTIHLFVYKTNEKQTKNFIQMCEKYFRESLHQPLNFLSFMLILKISQSHEKSFTFLTTRQNSDKMLQLL